MRKAQAAMEFLMTYGWAILVVLVAIAALAYFGVLNPGKLLPRICTIGNGVSCEAFKVTATNTTVVVRNGMGLALNSVTLTVGGVACEPASVSIADGATQTFSCAISAGNPGTRYRGEIAFTYTQEGTTLSNTLRGSLTTTVE